MAKKNIKCEHCKKPLKEFTVTTDWDKRKLHKKCWKKIQDNEDDMDYINLFV